MVKSGLPVRYKNGDKSNYVRRGPNYHIPLRNPCEQKNPTEPLKRPLFPLLFASVTIIDFIQETIARGSIIF